MQLSKYLPTSGTKLDAIKIFAMLAMVIGHINLVYFDDSFLPIAMLGRGWFSLFCYATACSIFRIQEQNKEVSPYIVSILILATITQPFYNIGFDSNQANALFTLATASAIAFKFDSFDTKIRIVFFSFAVLDALFFQSAWEYGIAGTMLPVTILMVLKNQRHGIPCFLLMLFCANISPMPESNAFIAWLVSGILTFTVAVIGLTAFLLIPITLCPETGKRLLPRYAMHIFYPAHLLLLGITAPFVQKLFI